nr:MAG TPA: hypothetical protein [Caudoviricetes sp.]
MRRDLLPDGLPHAGRLRTELRSRFHCLTQIV